MSHRIVRLLLPFVLLLFLSLSSPSPVVSVPPAGPPSVVSQASDYCPPLDPPPPGHTVVDVSSKADLIYQANNASSETTIRIADGTYTFADGDYIRITASNVTIRSASGNRDAVVIDGEPLNE